MAFSSHVQQTLSQGNPAPSYELSWQDTEGGGIPTYAAHNFGIAGATVVTFTSDWRVNAVTDRSRAGWGLWRDTLGIGICVVVDNLGGGAWTLSLGTAASWAQYGSIATSATGLVGLTADAWFRMHITGAVNPDNSLTVTATLRTTSDVDIGSVTSTFITARGDYCGFYSLFAQLGGTSFAWFDNINVAASGASGYVPANQATSYVFTYVNDLGEESAPSLPSLTVVRPDGVSATVTTPTTLPTGISTDYGIDRKRIYRAATGNTGTAFLFVAEIDLATADYVDVLTDAELGEVLPSDLWTLPPDDLRGILALPNGIMTGFRRNQLCLSAQNQPHAWPVQYRLNTDTNIVGIGNIDNTVVIGTESFVYVATGNDPANYSMSKFEVPYACMSKQSFAYLTGIGVVFAGTNGLMAVSGIGQVRNLTENVFTDRQWKALSPSNMRGLAHNDIYWLFSSTTTGGSGGVAATLLEDTFTGTLGTLLYLHSPDTKPSDFAWTNTSPDDLTLTGSGSVTNIAETSIECPSTGTWSLPLTFPFRLELDTTVGTTFGSRNWFTVNGPAGSYVKLTVGYTSPNNYVKVETNTAQLTVNVTTPATGSHSYAATVYETEITIEQDSVVVGTLPVDMTGFSSTQSVSIDITITSQSIQRIALLTLSSPLVATNHAYAIDMKPTGFGVIPLSFHANAGYVDPVGDTMYLVLDEDDEPDDPSLPIPPTTPMYIDGTHVYEFEGSDTDLMTYRWKGKLWLLERPSVMLMAQVKAEDYSNLLLRVYGDGVQIDEVVITGETEFTLVTVDEYTTLQIELIGTSTVRTVQVVEDVQELT